jgi:integrase
VTNNTDEPVFMVYGNTKGFDSASTALRKLIKERLNIYDPSLVPYSARHTFIDRARSAKGVSLARAEYVTGHKSEGSSAIHKSYGTMTPPQVLLEDMLSIFAVTDWGYYD